jgi:hypothetical protein
MKSITKKIPLLKSGDKYIHFTKYGGINTGIIQQVKTARVVRIINFNNRVEYIKHTIITQNGIELELDGSDGEIYKILN